MAIDTDALSNEVGQSLGRLKDAFAQNYGQYPIYDGARKIGKIEIEGKKIYLSFRGSLGTECLACVDVRKLPLAKWGLEGKVHAGIYRIFNGVQKSIDTFWNQHCSQKHTSDFEFIFDGYSLGSGLATLAASYWGKKFPQNRIKVFTYSSMNIFDETAARGYAKNINHWSFSCTDDVISRWLSFRGWGFFSVGKKIVFSSADSPSFLKRVHINAYTHLTQNRIVSALARFFIPIRVWEAHMPETYEDGAPLAVQKFKSTCLQEKLRWLFSGLTEPVYKWYI